MEPINEAETYLTTPEVAERLGISVRRVQALIHAGKLPSIQMGRDHVIKESDLVLVAERKPGRPKIHFDILHPVYVLVSSKPGFARRTRVEQAAMMLAEMEKDEPEPERNNSLLPYEERQDNLNYLQRAIRSFEEAGKDSARAVAKPKPTKPMARAKKTAKKKGARTK